eukprot:scaffold3678_cov106-Alexandrium_tamarense.AAC.5
MVQSQWNCKSTSIGELEKLGFLVAYHTNGEWVVTSPKGERIVFKRDTGLCDRLPYVNVRKNRNALAMIQMVRDSYEGFTKKEIEMATLARKVQAMVGHPTDPKFKDMVSNKVISNCPIKVIGITNAARIFGPCRFERQDSEA